MEKNKTQFEREKNTCIRKWKRTRLSLKGKKYMYKEMEKNKTQFEREKHKPQKVPYSTPEHNAQII